jgi:hypothetical protein
MDGWMMMLTGWLWDNWKLMYYWSIPSLREHCYRVLEGKRYPLREMDGCKRDRGSGCSPWRARREIGCACQGPGRCNASSGIAFSGPLYDLRQQGLTEFPSSVSVV